MHLNKYYLVIFSFLLFSDYVYSSHPSNEDIANRNRGKGLNIPLIQERRDVALMPMKSNAPQSNRFEAIEDFKRRKLVVDNQKSVVNNQEAFSDKPSEDY